MSETAPDAGPAIMPPQDPGRVLARSGRPRTIAAPAVPETDDIKWANGVPLPPGRLLNRAELRALGDCDLPCSDETPMDSHEQWLAVLYTFSVLAARYRGRKNVSVHANMFLYYEAQDVRDAEGRLPRGITMHERADGRLVAWVAPDVLVAFDRPRRERRKSYRTWDDDGKVPDFVMEVASDSSYRDDYNYKATLYERLGVAEYFIFDSRSTVAHPRLTAFRLNAAGRFDELQPMPQEGVRSEVLGLIAHVVDERLRWRDPVLKEDLRDYIESEDARKMAERDRDDAERNRGKAERALAESEERVAELEAELAALRTGQPHVPRSSG